MTPTSPPSHSGENKIEVKAESSRSGTVKMQSVALEDTSEFKVHNSCIPFNFTLLQLPYNSNELTSTTPNNNFMAQNAFVVMV